MSEKLIHKYRLTQSHLCIKCQEVAACILACRTALKQGFSGKNQTQYRQGGDTGHTPEAWLNKARGQQHTFVPESETSLMLLVFF